MSRFSGETPIRPSYGKTGGRNLATSTPDMAFFSIGSVAWENTNLASPVGTSAYFGEGIGTRAEVIAHPVRAADHHSPQCYNPGSFTMPFY